MDEGVTTFSKAGRARHGRLSLYEVEMNTIGEQTNLIEFTLDPELFERSNLHKKERGVSVKITDGARSLTFYPEQETFEEDLTALVHRRGIEAIPSNGVLDVFQDDEFRAEVSWNGSEKKYERLSWNTQTHPPVEAQGFQWSPKPTIAQELTALLEQHGISLRGLLTMYDLSTGEYRGSLLWDPEEKRYVSS